ncbi:MAG TPA: biotin--[acetyl-CoA-carboxylase] ligase [Bacteroidota bacterium]|nr:biotin--[acetyl-CoA-carboxylase] ligase [Bacteroidota bacterium]
MAMYSKEELLQGLQTRVIGKKIFVFETIDSTNACARTLGDAGGDEGELVIAEFQTSGRGRLGRSWIAEEHTSLLFSILLRPQVQAEMAGLLTLFASAAVARAIERIAASRVECKWPNDLLLGGKKFCGILLENSLQQTALRYSIVGIGINVNQQTFSPEIADRATSLALHTGGMVDRKAVLQSVLREMDEMYPAIREGDFDFVVKEWTDRCTMFGKHVKVLQHDHVIEGKALRLHQDAGLVLSTPDGPVTVYAGDVTIIS